jgi:hypothetical protein
MPPATTSCPFCNAAVPVALPLPANRRVTCPRCGELVPVKGEDALAGAAVSEPTSGAAPAEPPYRRSNRQIGLGVLGLMMFMAAVGLGYALKTVEFRRSNDVKNKDAGDTPAPIAEGSPADLAGVGYLPDDVQLIAGVRLAAARQSQAARTMLGRFGLSPDGDGRVFGFRADDVDHVILGASLKALPPRLTLVLRGRRPIDADAVRTALPAGRAVDHGDKTLYEARPANGPQGLVWFADDRTVVGGLVKEHFDKLPPQRNPSPGRFQIPLPELLRNRLDPAALVWAVLHIEPDDATAGALIGLLPLPADERAACADLRDLTVSLRADGPRVALAVQARGRDAAAADRFDDVVEKSLGAAGVVLSERKKDGDWLRLAADLDGEALGKWSGRWQGRAGP